MQLGQKYRSKIKMTTLNNSQFDTLVTKTMTSYMIGSMKVYQVSSFKHMSLVKLTQFHYFKSHFLHTNTSNFATFESSQSWAMP